jgi:hypothetical protein
MPSLLHIGPDVMGTVNNANLHSKKTSGHKELLGGADF